MDVAMNNGHETVRGPQVDGASMASSEDYNNAPPSPSSTNEQSQMENGLLASTRPKEQTDRFGFIGGKQFTKDSDWHTPVQVIRRREIKWLDMLDDWDKWMSKKPKKVRERCRKGIPCSIRSRAWQHLCGSKKLYEQNKARWQELDTMEGDPKWIDVIQKDLDRQFPFHEMFASRDGYGQQDLFRILKAYSIYNPRDGYCQAQAPVAAVLLMHMPAEDAFWALVQICEKYLTGYYSPGLEAVQIDGQVLAGLMKKESPTCHKHMKKHRIEPILYMTEWFMCIFSRTLPWPSVLRVWDVFFCEGVKVLFRVGLVLLKHTLGRSELLADRQGLYETMEALKNIPAEITQEDFLASEMLKLRVFERDLEEEHSLSLARRRVIKERQLAPEKAAAMARDIDILRKKKRGKVKPPPVSLKQDGFGSQDLIAQERSTALAVSPHRDVPTRLPNERHADMERIEHAYSSGGRSKFKREIHVDNPPKELIFNSTENAVISPGASKEKSPKSKDSNKEEKKKGKVEKKKNKSHQKEDLLSVESPPGGDKDRGGKMDKKDKDKKKPKTKEKKEDMKIKKMEKSDKKHKDKVAHSSSQHLSPIEDPEFRLEELTIRSHGNKDAGWHGDRKSESSDPSAHRTSPVLEEHNFSAAAQAHHEIKILRNFGVNDAGTNDSYDVVSSHQSKLSPSLQASHHQDHSEEPSSFPSVGLETPV